MEEVRRMKLGLRHIILAICCLLLTGCSLCEVPGNIQRSMEERAQRYPWVREPVDEEHKAQLCAAWDWRLIIPFAGPAQG